MKSALLYNGSVNSTFCRQRDLSPYQLLIMASDDLGQLAPLRDRGAEILRYCAESHDPTCLRAKVESPHNGGIFYDAAHTSAAALDGVAAVLHGRGKQLAVNTGWGTLDRLDYGAADMVMVESFVGTHLEGDGGQRAPTRYRFRDEETDRARVAALVQQGYDVIALTYGPPNDQAFCARARSAAQQAGAAWFVYTQPPGWEAQGSGFEFWQP